MRKTDGYGPVEKGPDGVCKNAEKVIERRNAISRGSNGTGSSPIAAPVFARAPLIATLGAKVSSGMSAMIGRRTSERISLYGIFTS